MNKLEYKDKDGIKYKHPERTCKDCLEYPCQELKVFNLGCDYAKYGCIHYHDKDSESTSDNI